MKAKKGNMKKTKTDPVKEFQRQAVEQRVCLFYVADRVKGILEDSKTDAQLRDQLEEFKDEKISARFQSVIVLIDPVDGSKNIFHGSWEGRIILKPRGKNGFGYDPLFYIEDLESTAGELNQVEKNKLSHRAIAMWKVTDYLTKKTSDTE